MRIVIAGAGEVGTHLAKMLSRENFDIILIDPDEEKLNMPSLSGLDILTVVGNPVSPIDLNEAGAKNADLFVAVTPEEMTNVMACTIAANLGASKTIARINNYEYLLPKNSDLFKKLGVTSLIYPEMLAAKEIVSSIQRPWTRQYWELFGGSILLLGLKIRENAPIRGKRLEDLHVNKEDKLFHIVVINRHNHTIIPRGNDTIEDGDIVYFTTTRDNIKHVQQVTGKLDNEVKRLVIMGGGRIAIRATQYLPDNIRVKLIELDREKSYRIAEKTPNNVMVINGDGRDTELLLQEGIRDMDAFIALTENASTNILACMVAKRYGVTKTVAQVENLDYIQLAESMDVGSIINKKLIAASYIYQYLLDADVANVKCLAFANADVLEMVARPGSKITRKKVRDLSLPKDITIGGLLRNGESLLVDGDTQILPQDHVVVFCMDTAFRKIEDYFN